MHGCNVVLYTSRQHGKLVKEGNPQAVQHLLERLYGETFASWFAGHVRNSLVNLLTNAFEFLVFQYFFIFSFTG